MPLHTFFTPVRRKQNTGCETRPNSVSPENAGMHGWPHDAADGGGTGCWSKPSSCQALLNSQDPAALVAAAVPGTPWPQV